MKKLIVAAMLVVGMTTFAQEKNAKPLMKASEKIDAKQRADENLKQLTEELKLSDDQQKHMAEIIEVYSAKREAALAERKANIANKTKITAEESKKINEERKAERQVYNEKIKTLLTAEQYAKWEQLNQQKKSKAKAE